MTALIATALPYVQIVLSILLVALILVQRSGSGAGGPFGGDNFSAGFHTRRGVERPIFQVSIAVAVLFALTGLLALII